MGNILSSVGRCQSVITDWYWREKMDRIKQKLKGAFRTGDQESDEEPELQASGGGLEDEDTGENGSSGGHTVGFAVGFADEPPPERKERKPRFADMDDEGPHEGGGKMNSLCEITISPVD